MADITMCEGKDCPLKEKCRRFTDTPTPKRQSWFTISPWKENNGVIKCEFFWGDNSDQIIEQIKDILKPKT